MWKFQEDQSQVPVDQESIRGQSVAAVADFEPNVCIHGRALDKCRMCAEQLEHDRWVYCASLLLHCLLLLRPSLLASSDFYDFVWQFCSLYYAAGSTYAVMLIVCDSEL